MQGWEAIAEHTLAIYPYRVRMYMYIHRCFEIGGFYNFFGQTIPWLFQETKWHQQSLMPGRNLIFPCSLNYWQGTEIGRSMQGRTRGSIYKQTVRRFQR